MTLLQRGTVARIAPVLALVCTAVFAYGLSGPDIGWLSDDYADVYGVSSPVPDWRTAFGLGGGHWSPYRLLRPPLQGYLGSWLGPGNTHVLQFTGHLVCVLLFYRLLKRLAWPTWASLAAGLLFGSSPWIAQAVYWWAGASVNWATVLVLIASHCFLLWSETHRRRWLFAYTCFTLLSLMTYELWLGGFLFFGGLDWYYCRVRSSTRKTWWLWRYGGIAAPYLIYAVLFAIAPSEDADRIGVNVRDLPFAFVLVQLRTFQWPLDVQWRWALLAAGQAFRSALGVSILAAQATVLVLLGVAWVRSSLRRTDSQTAITQVGVPVWESLVLGWSLLLGSRIVLILQDSVSRFDTRLAYGASMGLAVAGVALVSGVVQHRLVGVRLRAMVGVTVLAVVLILGWASAGIGVHYVKTSQAEAQTIRALDHWIATASSPLRGRTIVVVVARSAVAQGAHDVSYFFDLEGTWLDFAMKRRCPACNTYVTETVDCVEARNTIAVHEVASTYRTQPASNGRVTLSDQTVFFRWTGRELMPEKGACQPG